MLGKSTKVRKFEQRTEQFIQHRIFDFDQKKMQEEFNGGGVRPNDVPTAEESKRFLSDIQSIGKAHNRESEWLKDITNEMGNDKHLQEKVVINLEKVTR